jgi:hypothetical protein
MVGRHSPALGLPVSTSTRSNATAIAALRAKADRDAVRVLPVIAIIRAKGITAHAGIARELNARGVQTPRGGQWTSASVRKPTRSCTVTPCPRSEHRPPLALQRDPRAPKTGARDRRLSIAS